MYAASNSLNSSEPTDRSNAAKAASATMNVLRNLILMISPKLCFQILPQERARLEQYETFILWISLPKNRSTGRIQGEEAFRRFQPRCRFRT